MAVTFRKLHPHIGAEASAADLRGIHDRATPFDDANQLRELRRVTTIDVVAALAYA